jgi:hypothetical protein
MEADLRGVFDESSSRALAAKHLAAGAEYVLFQRAKPSESYFHRRVFVKKPERKGFYHWYLEKVGVTFSAALSRGVCDLELLQQCWEASALENSGKSKPQTP